LKLGYDQAMVSQEYQTLSKVISGLFGGGKKPINPIEPKTEQEAAQLLSGVFGGRLAVKGM